MPYFQLHYTYDEIRDVMPTLSVEEIRAIERYFEENRDAMLEMDRRIRERNAKRKNPPEVEAILRRGREKALARLEAIRQQRGQGRNGEGTSG